MCLNQNLKIERECGHAVSMESRKSIPKHLQCLKKFNNKIAILPSFGNFYHPTWWLLTYNGMWENHVSKWIMDRGKHACTLPITSHSIKLHSRGWEPRSSGLSYLKVKEICKHFRHTEEETFFGRLWSFIYSHLARLLDPCGGYA